ncbi:MAG TPA: NAD(P)H-dependent oxidoreductase [Luteimonas sp.]|nr:NAD(P)H-dependent oxidoreductase [Luteimonas sp.]
MRLLQIDSSALGARSVTRVLTAAIAARWQDAVPGTVVDYRDLDADPVAPVSSRTLAGADPAADADAARILAQVQAADVIVIGAPMYNFSVPTALKAWIDRITVAGATFRYTAAGPEGMLGGRRVVVAIASGGVHAGGPEDFVEPYLRTVLAFVGLTDVSFIRAEGIASSPAHRQAALAQAMAAIPVVLRAAA